MAKGQPLSRHQKGIVNRYYQHKDSQTALKLQELVSELYLCEDDKKRGRLWAKAGELLASAGANRPRVEKVLADRDVEALGKLVADVLK